MLIIPLLVLILCIAASRLAAQRYKEVIDHGSQERAPTAHTGAEIARLFLAEEEATDVQVVEHSGTVTDYFDPARRRLFLRPEFANGTTMAAWAVALHEAAHATQTGESLGELKWRQSVIRLNRYGPVFTAIAVLALTLARILPARLALVAFGAACAIFLLLNLGTLGIEFNANARLRRFLEKHLAKTPSAWDKLEVYLSRVATREAGDLLRSPRYFLFSAMPGSGNLRPRNKEDP